MFHIIAIAETGDQDLAMEEREYFTIWGDFHPLQTEALGYPERHQAEWDQGLIGNLSNGLKTVIIYHPEPALCG